MTRLTTSFPLRIPDDMREQVARRAAEHRRSLNSELLDLLQRALTGIFPTSTSVLEITSPEEVEQMGKNTLGGPRGAYLKVIDRDGPREKTRGYQIIPMSDMERRLLDHYRKLTPSKQLAILALFEDVPL
jgi:plasmid stability protein